jgi:hypothetical protein
VRPTGLSRRRALGLLGAAGAGLTAGIVALTGRSGGLPAELAANLARLPGAERLARVGEAVLASGSLDRGVVELAADVAPSGAADPLGWCGEAEPEDLVEHVRAAAAGDFAAGTVVVVDGWRLARTEAALSALVALR